MPNKVFFVSLGCDKNLVDSEHMLKRLVDAGYVLCDDEYEADAIIVNSCCFIGDAMEESIQTLIELGSLKENGSLSALIVCGCLAEHFSNEIREEIPEVDGIVGTNSYDEIVSVLDSCLSNNPIEKRKALVGLCDDTPGRMLTTGGHYAYLKIAEGCNKRCAYCLIPYLRGNYRSIPMESILKEANELVSSGVKELILVAQETTVYGMDLYGKKSLHKLLYSLNEIEGLEWIRILYAYPEEIYEEMIVAMKECEKVCHYLDLPIQHCNDEILSAMNRKTNKADLLKMISHLRSEIPDICLRTTVICGFPGETEDQHLELVDFIKETRFDRLGAFAYSQQQDTPAASFDNQIDEEVKALRVQKVMETQQKVSFDLNNSFIGKETRAFVEGMIPEEDLCVLRTYRDAPGVDGFLFVESPCNEYYSGSFVDVVITDAKDYDLIGEIKNEFT